MTIPKKKFNHESIKLPLYESMQGEQTLLAHKTSREKKMIKAKWNK
jgi:hypothetical protein